MTHPAARTENAVTGVVLAGGDSTRFGSENKALASVDDEPVLERVLCAVDACTDQRPVVAVRSPRQRAELEDALDGRAVRFAVDREGFEGPVAGIATAVDRCSTPWLLVCACDMPLIAPDALFWLAERREPGIDAVAPTEDGRYHPLLTLYRRDAVERLLDRLPAAAGLRSLLERLESVRTVPVEATPPGVDLERSLVSVDTKRDLAAVSVRR